ncbi:hypothetical protein C1A50_5277 [Paenibacillus polymyxa]|nr:hypothetical protein C1A50_5277 [Paenibacillus polymyxa]
MLEVLIDMSHKRMVNIGILRRLLNVVVDTDASKKSSSFHL